jgi:dihydrolipoamide dehydrogenase
MSEIEVKVPDLGGFENVEIIEVLVSPGDEIQIEDSLVTVESDKASMEIPASQAGVIKSLKVKMGDKISEGDVLLVIEAGEQAAAETAQEETQPEAPVETAEAEPVAAPAAASFSGEADLHTEVLVLGSGPGGYTAAFRAADLGKKVILVERYDSIGGVCLNVGCIPSKALLHTAEIISEAAEMADHGIVFGKPKIDLPKLAAFKSDVVGKLTGGLAQLAKQRKVQIVTGYGRFTSPNTIEVEGANGKQVISFDNAIIAAGSSVTKLPFIPWDDPRVMDSTDALELEEVPKRMLVVGGGIIGLEMATVYDALGSSISVVELSEGLIPGCDRDLVRPLERRIKKRYENIWLNTRVTEIIPEKNGLKVRFEGKNAPEEDTFDRVLVAIGRSPNGKLIDAEKAGVMVDERGFIQVDKQQHTNVDHIYAIGDIVGQPMLAHKATYEAVIAAEVICGMKSFFDARTIPSVAYTDPEVAWMGMSETEATEQGVEFEKGVFPWAASGRSLSIGRNEGVTKVLFGEDGRLIGAGITGPNAGELIGEAVLALEMGADAEDIGLTIHPHPTLSETFKFAAEVAEGVCTDIYMPKKKK